jgi:hypothetical protein
MAGSAATEREAVVNRRAARRRSRFHLPVHGEPCDTCSTRKGTSAMRALRGGCGRQWRYARAGGTGRARSTRPSRRRARMTGSRCGPSNRTSSRLATRAVATWRASRDRHDAVGGLCGTVGLRAERSPSARKLASRTARRRTPDVIPGARAAPRRGALSVTAATHTRDPLASRRDATRAGREPDRELPACRCPSVVTQVENRCARQPRRWSAACATSSNVPDSHPPADPGDTRRSRVAASRRSPWRAHDTEVVALEPVAAARRSHGAGRAARNAELGEVRLEGRTDPLDAAVGVRRGRTRGAPTPVTRPCG